MEVHFVNKYIVSDSRGFESDVARDFALVVARGNTKERASVIVSLAHHISSEDALGIYEKMGSPQREVTKMLTVRREDMLEDIGKLIKIGTYDIDTACLIVGLKHKMEASSVYEIYARYVRKYKAG